MGRLRQIAALDLFMNGMVLFLMLVLLERPFLNPPTSEAKAEPPGNLIVHVTWPEGNTDVDLWVDGPGELTPVGYSNKGGVLWNLLRDDLDNSPDATPLNFENAYTRGIPKGEYQINVHCYRCPQLPVPVDVEVSMNSGAGKAGGSKTASKILFTAKLQLESNHQELTAVAFYMDGNGELIKNSMHNVFRELRRFKSDGVPSRPDF